MVRLLIIYKFTWIQLLVLINLNFMKTYIAILKGINVGGHKKIMMADLRKMLCEISYIGEVNTYIQSGNIVFKASEENTDVLENLIQQKIADHYGFEVSTIVLSKENLSSIIDSNPYAEEEIKRFRNDGIVIEDLVDFVLVRFSDHHSVDIGFCA